MCSESLKDISMCISILDAIGSNFRRLRYVTEIKPSLLIVLDLINGTQNFICVVIYHNGRSQDTISLTTWSLSIFRVQDDRQVVISLL